MTLTAFELTVGVIENLANTSNKLQEGATKKIRQLRIIDA